MKTGQKVLLLLLGASAVGVGAYFMTKKPDTDNQDPGTPPPLPSGPTPAPGNPSNTTPIIQPGGYDYDYVVQPTNKAYVQEMQRILGIPADGIWGAQTKSSLLKYGLTTGFTLRTLLTKKGTGTPTVTTLKAGDHVYARNDMVINRATFDGRNHAKSDQTTTFKRDEWIGEVISIWPNGNVVIIKRNPAGYLYYTTQDKVRVFGVSGLIGI